MTTGLTIADFWQARLNVLRPSVKSLVVGWSLETQEIEAFQEAPLSVDSEISAVGDETSSEILFVSAPGAVGKSTLARQIAAKTGAVYIDLAKSDPVGGNTLSGGLAKSGLFNAWQENTTAVLVDGLDEARIRVTQGAFEAFLKDIWDLSKGRTVPTVLFGRTGAVQDSWLLLSEQNANCAVLEIGFYDETASVDFALRQLRKLRPGEPHEESHGRAIRVLLEKLREQTESDGDRFAGYAPVLRAVAERVAGVGNPATLIADIERGGRPVTLQDVTTAILERERNKLSTLEFEDQTLHGRLYSPQEQLDRLVSRIYGLAPPNTAQMSPKDSQAYLLALQSWLPEHPFLDGGQSPSSAVFDAIICTHALRMHNAADAAVKRELMRGVAANPFLAEFYLPNDAVADPVYMPPEHIGILYASLRARLSLGDTASLTVDAPEDADGTDALRADVEIVLSRRDSERARTLRFSSEQAGKIRIGTYVEDVEIDAPFATVEIGPGPEAILIGPTSVQCDHLVFSTEKVIAEAVRGRQAEAVVYLEAQRYTGDSIVQVSASRGCILNASWPGVQSYPWNSYATEGKPQSDPRLEEALRRFRRFIIAFRSHSKGQLARFRDKLDHARMTKGSGRAILDLMIDEKIVSYDQAMYYLDADRLGSISGATYADCVNRNFSSTVIAFVQRALNN